MKTKGRLSTAGARDEHSPFTIHNSELRLPSAYCRLPTACCLLPTGYFVAPFEELRI